MTGLDWLAQMERGEVPDENAYFGAAGSAFQALSCVQIDDLSYSVVRTETETEPDEDQDDFGHSLELPQNLSYTPTTGLNCSRTAQLLPCEHLEAADSNARADFNSNSDDDSEPEL